MMILSVSLIVLNLVALPLIAWWLLSANRRQRNNDLRYHRNILLITSTLNSPCRKAV